MALSHLPTKTVDGIEYIDYRPSLYYNKYKYRARFYCRGITLAWFNRNEKEIEDKIKRYNKRFGGANVKHIIDFTLWKEKTKKDKTAMTRIEGDTASIFSNDLQILKTLEIIGCTVDYTEVDVNIEKGVKYFVKEPKYKNRIYLRNKKVSEECKTKLYNFIERYKNTGTIIVPSNSMRLWLLPEDQKPTKLVNSWFYQYKQTHSSANYFIDYNDDSIITMFSIMFPGMINKSYKLEKRPDNI